MKLLLRVRVRQFAIAESSMHYIERLRVRVRAGAHPDIKAIKVTPH